jgi:hypothetical protein
VQNGVRSYGFGERWLDDAIKRMAEVGLGRMRVLRRPRRVEPKRSRAELRQ